MTDQANPNERTTVTQFTQFVDMPVDGPAVDVLAMDSTTSPWTELFREEAARSGGQARPARESEGGSAGSAESEDEWAALDALFAAFGE